LPRGEEVKVVVGEYSSEELRKTTKTHVIHGLRFPAV
jgi:hypothetical protein